jgi:protein AFG1
VGSVGQRSDIGSCRHLGHDERFAYKRALSRLKDMTSTTYARDTEWSPLPAEMRKWESSEPGPNLVLSGARPPPLDTLEAGPDYATEAAYEGGRAPPRPEAPKLKEHHVWGVREDWGPKAGSWGKGAKAYGREQERRE